MVLPGLSSLPVIDRDEARFAQASVQMADTNDLLNIRFQDEARNKKPAAAYWAQTAMIKVFAAGRKTHLVTTYPVRSRGSPHHIRPLLGRLTHGWTKGSSDCMCAYSPPPLSSYLKGILRKRMRFFARPQRSCLRV